MAVRFRDLLVKAWPTDTAKHAARASGMSVRTTEAWVTGRRSPSSDALLLMADRDPHFSAIFLEVVKAMRAKAPR